MSDPERSTRYDQAAVDRVPRDVVVARLDRLFGDWAGEQAIQFEGRWHTWGELARVRAALDDLLVARPLGSRAAGAIVMRQRPALVAAELAVMSTGRAAVLISPLQGDRALAQEIVTLRPALLVAHEADWARPGVADAVAEAGSLGLVVGDDFALTLRSGGTTSPPGPELDAAVTVLTSGTTGPPKRLPVAWETFVRLGGGPDGRVPRSDRGAMILSLPLVTLGGLLSVSRLVFGGRPLSMMERFDVQTWAALVKEHRPNVIGAPPPVVQMILDADISPDHFDGVTAFTTASAAIPPDVARAFEERYGIPVLLGYGATEFLNSVTGWRGDLWAQFGPTKLGSVGRALPGVRLRVLDPATLDDDDPREVAPGEEGILEVDPPERTGHLPSGWLRTADRARIDADGFVWILGRADDVIIRGGFKVDLNTVESTLREHPDVADVAVVGLDDVRLGSVPGAAVVSRPGARLSVESLLEWSRDRLPPYALPAVVRMVDAIPRTSTFKPHRDEIRQLLGST